MLLQYCWALAAAIPALEVAAAAIRAVRRTGSLPEACIRPSILIINGQALQSGSHDRSTWATSLPDVACSGMSAHPHAPAAHRIIATRRIARGQAVCSR